MGMDIFKDHLARFLMLLAAMLAAMSLYYGVESILVSRPIIVPIDPPFKICNGYSTIKPGGVVCYKIHYYKRLDIPGEITKQLIIKDANGKEIYLPLEYSSGHLPTGDTQAQAYVLIPSWVPEGAAKIKLTSAHFTGRVRQFATVYTEPFEVKK